MGIVVDKKSLFMDGFYSGNCIECQGNHTPEYVWYLETYCAGDLRLKELKFCRIFSNPDFSRARAAQEQGTSARRRSILLRGLNNTVPVSLWLAFGEEHQTLFFVPHFDSL
jgi:hypothetical protein